MVGIAKWRSKLVFGALVLAGAIGGASVSPAPAATAAACENDECEWSLLGERCVENPGQSTLCNAVSGGCTTRACELTQITTN